MFFFQEPYERYFTITPGEIVLDVGSGIGEFTVHAAKKAKEVVAIEADPENRAWLQKNITENRLQNVHIVKKVVWNCRDSSLRLWLDEESIGGHSLVIKKGKKRIEVQADTLDNIISEIGIKKVDFMKMDVEGAELEALKGAKHVLNMTKKVVFETHLRKREKTTSVCRRFLEAQGFKVRVEILSDSCDMVYGERDSGSILG